MTAKLKDDIIKQYLKQTGFLSKVRGGVELARPGEVSEVCFFNTDIINDEYADKKVRRLHGGIYKIIDIQVKVNILHNKRNIFLYNVRRNEKDNVINLKKEINNEDISHWERMYIRANMLGQNDGTLKIQGEEYTVDDFLVFFIKDGTKIFNSLNNKGFEKYTSSNVVDTFKGLMDEL